MATPEPIEADHTAGARFYAGLALPAVVLTLVVLIPRWRLDSPISAIVSIAVTLMLLAFYVGVWFGRSWARWGVVIVGGLCGTALYIIYRQSQLGFGVVTLLYMLNLLLAVLLVAPSPVSQFADQRARQRERRVQEGAARSDSATGSSH